MIRHQRRHTAGGVEGFSFQEPNNNNNLSTGMKSTHRHHHGEQQLVWDLEAVVDMISKRNDEEEHGNRTTKARQMYSNKKNLARSSKKRSELSLLNHETNKKSCRADDNVEDNDEYGDEEEEEDQSSCQEVIYDENVLSRHNSLQSNDASKSPTKQGVKGLRVKKMKKFETAPVQDLKTNDGIKSNVQKMAVRKTKEEEENILSDLDQVHEVPTPLNQNVNDVDEVANLEIQRDASEIINENNARGLVVELLQNVAHSAVEVTHSTSAASTITTTPTTTATTSTTTTTTTTAMNSMITTATTMDSHYYYRRPSDGIIYPPPLIRSQQMSNQESKNVSLIFHRKKAHRKVHTIAPLSPFLRVLVVGSDHAGASSFICRTVTGKTPTFEQTLVASKGGQHSKVVSLGNNRVASIQLSRGRNNLTLMDIRQYHGAIVMVDLTNFEESLACALEWKNRLDQATRVSISTLNTSLPSVTDPFPVVLIGSKCDAVPNECAWFIAESKLEKAANSAGFAAWYMTSNEDGTRVDAAVQRLVQSMVVYHEGFIRQGASSITTTTTTNPTTTLAGRLFHWLF